MKKLILIFTILTFLIGSGQQDKPSGYHKDGILFDDAQTPNVETLWFNLFSNQYGIIRYDRVAGKFRVLENGKWKDLFGSGESTDDLNDVVQRGNSTTSSIITRGLTIQQNNLILDSFTGMYELTLVNPTGHSADRTQTFTDADGILEVYSGEYNASTNTPNLSNATLQPGAYYRVTTAGSQDFGNGSIDFAVGDYVGCNDSEWFKKIDNNQSGSGADSITWQTEITTNTTFSGTQKGAFNFYPVNSASAVQITINKGTYVAGDVIPIHRKGFGSVEIVAGTDVRLNGKRDIDNRFFINDVGSDVFVQMSHLDGSTLVGNVIGNVTGGYTGVAVASTYSELREGDTAVNLTITGSGLSNATVSFGTGINLNSVVSTSPTQMVVNVDVTGVATDTVDVTFNNGDIITYADDITILATAPTGIAYYKFDETSGTTVNDENATYNGTNNGATINVAGFENTAYSFDGVDDYVVLSDFGLTTFPFTIEFYLKSSSYTGLKWIAAFNDATNYSGFNI